VRKSDHPAGDGKHRAELGVDQADQQDHDRAEQPGENRDGPCDVGGLERAERHPDPMIEPTPANSRPTGPTCLRRPLVASSAA
jgi:hypothetical protein